MPGWQPSLQLACCLVVLQHLKLPDVASWGAWCFSRVKPSNLKVTGKSISPTFFLFFSLVLPPCISDLLLSRCGHELANRTIPSAVSNALHFSSDSPRPTFPFSLFAFSFLYSAHFPLPLYSISHSLCSYIVQMCVVVQEGSNSTCTIWVIERLTPLLALVSMLDQAKLYVVSSSTQVVVGQCTVK